MASRDRLAGATITRILYDPIAAPSSVVSELPPALDAIVLKGLAVPK